MGRPIELLLRAGQFPAGGDQCVPVGVPTDRRRVVADQLQALYRDVDRTPELHRLLPGREGRDPCLLGIQQIGARPLHINARLVDGGGGRLLRLVPVLVSFPDGPLGLRLDRVQILSGDVIEQPEGQGDEHCAHQHATLLSSRGV